MAQKPLDTCYQSVIAHSTQKFPHLKQILVAGGYSRDEGGVFTTQEYSVPINDLDIYLVFKSNQPQKSQLKKLSQIINLDISKKLNLPVGNRPNNQFFSFPHDFFIDLYTITHKQAQDPLRIIRYWEMAHKVQVIWGQQQNPFAKFPQSKIPLSEGIRFLSNQLTIPVKFYLFNRPTEEALYFLHRTWTNFATALLLLKSRLKPSYLDRAREFSQIYSKDFPDLSKKLPQLDKKIFRSTKFKIKPDFLSFQNLSHAQKKQYLQNISRDTCITGIEIYDYYLKHWLNGKTMQENMQKLRDKYYQGYVQSPIIANSVNLSLGLLFTGRTVSPDIQVFQNTKSTLEAIHKHPKSSKTKTLASAHLSLFKKAKQSRTFVQSIKNLLS